MAEITPGRYRFALTAYPFVALDAEGRGNANGTNVRLYDYDYSDAETFEVEGKGKAWNIRSVYSGRLLSTDTAVPAAGSNSVLWKPITTRVAHDQLYDIEAVGRKQVIDGVECDVVRLRINRFAEAKTSKGAKVMLGSLASEGVRSITLYGCQSVDHTKTVSSVKMGSETIALPQELRALPNGVRDEAVIKGSTISIHQRVGVITQYDKDKDKEVITASPYVHAKNGILIDGTSVWYQLPEIGNDLDVESVNDLPFNVPTPESNMSIESDGVTEIVVEWVGLPSAEESLYVTADSQTSGANVKLVKGLPNAKLAEFTMIPFPAFESGGLYEIVPLFDTTKAVDVSGNGTSNGTACKVYKRNGSMTQKFYFIRDDDNKDKWAIRSIKGGKYLYAEWSKRYGSDDHISDVFIWDPYSKEKTEQRWYPTIYGYQMFDDVNCAIVSLDNWMTDPTKHSEKHYRMDFNSSKGQLRVYTEDTYHNQNDQRALLVPTSEVDPTLAYPTKRWSAWSIDDNSESTNPHGAYGGKCSIWPKWYCEDEWMSLGENNHYEMQTSYRFMDAPTGKWGDWSKTSPWKKIDCIVADKGVGERVTMQSGLHVELVSGQHKAVEAYWRVRGVSRDARASLKSDWGSCYTKICYAAELKVVEVGFSLDGFYLKVESDYPYGRCIMYVDKLYMNGRNILKKTYISKNTIQGSETYVYIDYDNLSDWPRWGASMKIECRVRTDLFMEGATWKYSCEMTMNSGNAPYIPTLEKPNWLENPGRRLKFEYDNNLPHIKSARAWMRYYDRTRMKHIIVPLDTPEEYVFQGKRLMEYFVPCPFGVEYQISYAYETKDNKFRVGLIEDKYDAAIRPFVWNCGDVVAALYLSSETPWSMTQNMTTDNSIVKMTGRNRDSVYFNKTISSTFSVSGVLYPEEGGVMPYEAGMLENILYMVGKYCTLRTPDGGIFRVAVTSVNPTYFVNKQYTKVDVSMTEIDD